MLKLLEAIHKKEEAKEKKKGGYLFLLLLLLVFSFLLFCVNLPDMMYVLVILLALQELVLLVSLLLFELMLCGSLFWLYSYELLVIAIFVHFPTIFQKSSKFYLKAKFQEI